MDIEEKTQILEELKTYLTLYRINKYTLFDYKITTFKVIQLTLKVGGNVFGPFRASQRVPEFATIMEK